MKTDSVFIPTLLSERGNKVSQNILAVFGGALLLAALAQISFRLPFTPVPLTGQTFGVLLISLLWGRTRGTAAVMSYLGLGIIGTPVFAFGASLAALGPSAGYLVGMLIATYMVGTLADRGWTKSFSRTLASSTLAIIAILACGVLVLSLFIPARSLLMAGVLPFLPGEILKIIIASLIATRLSHSKACE
jgi:biotin transport system substrate-specific component